MKAVITWLYRKFVFMPGLRKMRDPNEQYYYIVYRGGLNLVDDKQILFDLLEYFEGGGSRDQLSGT